MMTKSSMLRTRIILMVYLRKQSFVQIVLDDWIYITMIVVVAVILGMLYYTIIIITDSSL